MNPIIHNSPAFKESRKAFQGVNATAKGSIEKSKRRNWLKTKAIRGKSKHDVGQGKGGHDEYDSRQD